MAIKSISFKTRGMNKDLSTSASNNGFSFENMNMRIWSGDTNTFMSLTNEIGTKYISIKDASSNTDKALMGTPIGYAIIDEKLVIFTTSDDSDYIYLLSYSNEEACFKVTELFNGDLGFDISHPIETLVSYETEKIKKVYWVDGLNQPRVINIADTDRNYNNNSFDFVPVISNNADISITKIFGAGSFPSGVIQYYFTYYNRNGRQSNIFYSSPLYYVSPQDRGGSPEESNNVSFRITIDNVDTSFDYIRVYAVFRTSYNATPTVRSLIDIATSEDTIYIEDNGTSGSTEDSTMLLYLGGEQIIPQTIAQKDNVLFMGNIKQDSLMFTEEQETSIRNALSVSFDYRNITLPNKEGYYPWRSQLNESSMQIKTFKGGETYRIGVQYQSKTGRWSNTIWLADVKNDNYPKSSVYSNICQVAYVKVTSNGESNLDFLSNYVGRRLVMAEPSNNDRSILFQGVLCPTMYNVIDRCNNAPFSVPSWFMRPFGINSLTGLSGKTFRNELTWSHNSDSQDHYPNGEIQGAILGRSVRYPMSSNEGDNEENQYTADFWRETYPGGRRTRIWYNCTIPAFGISITKGNPEADYSGTTAYNRMVSEAARYIPSHLIPSKEDIDEAEPTHIQVNIGESERPSDLRDRAFRQQEYIYRVDLSRLTFHSPGIENYSDNFMENLKLRVVGIVPITSVLSDYFITTTTPAKSKFGGVVNYNFSSEDTLSGEKPSGLISAPIYMDLENYANDGGASTQDLCLYVVYPWQAQGSIVGETQNSDSTTEIHAKLERKVMSNLRFSYTTQYFNDSGTNKFWEAFINNNIYRTGITNVQVINTSEPEIFKINKPLYSDLYALNYLPNVDKVLYSGDTKNIYVGSEAVTISSSASTSIESAIDNSFASNLWRDKGDISPLTVPLKYKSTPHIFFALNYSANGAETILPAYSNFYKKLDNSDGGSTNSYVWSDNPIINQVGTSDTPTEGTLVAMVTSSVFGSEWYDSVLHPLTDGDYVWITDYQQYRINGTTIIYGGILQKYTGISGGQNLFQSTQNTIIRLDYNDNVYETANIQYDNLETNIADQWLYMGTGNVYSITQVESGDSDQTLFNQVILNDNNDPAEYPFLYIGELYRDVSTEVLYGGTSNEAKLANTWIPISEAAPIGSQLNGQEGDTYYQRWDCLKTYAYTNEDLNSIVDITSFMVESHINLDGRYDRNRGQQDNTNMSPENFNLFNEVYNQDNNYFIYTRLDERFNETEYPNLITFSRAKNIGEDIDTWTNVTMTSNVDSNIGLDGSKGEVRAIRRLANNLIVFQDTATSTILFNSSTPITSTDGVPIEIANSGKVEGIRYLSETLGCTNKWSIVNTPMGLYFIDTGSTCLYKYDGQFSNISEKGGFQSWSKDNFSNEIWKPENSNGYIGYYNYNDNELYYINKDNCLAYAESLQVFSSFYSYNDAPYYITINDKGFFISKSREDNAGDDYRLWGIHEGDYNYFFGKYQPFYTTVIANPEFQSDKIFNNLEFRADSWNDGALTSDTFDTLRVWNEYQDSGGTTNNLRHLRSRPSSLKQKFRIWRANIPRDSSNGRDRIRNPWIYLKLSKESDNKNKTMLHDLRIWYYE